MRYGYATTGANASWSSSASSPSVSVRRWPPNATSTTALPRRPARRRSRWRYATAARAVRPSASAAVSRSCSGDRRADALAAGEAAWWYRQRRYGPGLRRAMMTAPLQVIALSFSRDAGSGDRILAEVDRLRGRGVLRLLDMLFVAKSQDGTIERLTIGDDEDFGSLLTAVVPVANGGPAVPAPADGLAAFDPAGALALAGSLQPGTAVAFLLVEHYWAGPLFDAIAETGGTLIGEGFLTPETELVVGAEVAVMEEAAQVIAQAQADEATAVLTAAAA